MTQLKKIFFINKRVYKISYYYLKMYLIKNLLELLSVFNFFILLISLVFF